MTFFYYLIALLAFAATLGISFLFRRSGAKAQRIFRTVTGAVLSLAFLARYFGGRFAISHTLGLNRYSPFGNDGSLKALLSTLILWLICAAWVLLITSPAFIRSIGSLTILIRYFAFPVYAIAIVFLPMLATALDGPVYDGYTATMTASKADPFYFREIFLEIELGIGAGLAASFFFIKEEGAQKKHSPRLIVGAIIGMICASFPPYALQVIFGEAPTHLELLDLSLEHRIVLYGAIVIPVLLFLSLKNFDFDRRRYAMLFISVATMISYSIRYDYADLINIRAWPLHLCNTAMFIVPLCVAFMLDKLYYFTMFINVLGALFAMLMPNTAEGLNIIAQSSLDFWINHYCAFFMPLLLIALRIFKRPKFKEFTGSMIAFLGYYILVLVVNAWCVDTDFFFINSNFIAEKAGDWAEALVAADHRAFLTVFGHEMVFYPIYQTMFFLAYVGLAFAVWFVYEQFFEIADLYNEVIRRNKKIKADRLALEVALGGRSTKEPVKMDATNQLILDHFSKRYSTSDVYAVKDACLTVDGGQIFGFLGPNGAGKSTIIKSVVGIQTLTDGNIYVCGYDVEKQSVEAKMQIGFVPDHYALYENLTGREYVNYIADLYGVSKTDRTLRIDEYVERFHLQGAFDNQMKTYSHGMKQKITIMSALVHEPKLWILDEPLTGLDPESIFQVKECMKAHAAKGNIVFFSSHIIDVVERICDKIAIIKKGNILTVKTVAEIEATGEPLEHFYMRTIGELPPDEIPVSMGKAEAVAE